MTLFHLSVPFQLSGQFPHRDTVGKWYLFWELGLHFWKSIVVFSFHVTDQRVSQAENQGTRTAFKSLPDDVRRPSLSLFKLARELKCQDQEHGGAAYHQAPPKLVSRACTPGCGVWYEPALPHALHKLRRTEPAPGGPRQILSTLVTQAAI